MNKKTQSKEFNAIEELKLAKRLAVKRRHESGFLYLYAKAHEALKVPANMASIKSNGQVKVDAFYMWEPSFLCLFKLDGAQVASKTSTGYYMLTPNLRIIIAGKESLLFEVRDDQKKRVAQRCLSTFALAPPKGR